jgi:hypothetical protein
MEAIKGKQKWFQDFLPQSPLSKLSPKNGQNQKSRAKFAIS